MKLDFNYTTSSINQMRVYFRAIIISLGGLFFGFNNGSFNTTQEHINYLNGWTSSFERAFYPGLITSFLPLGCMIGSLLSNNLLKITQNNLRVCLLIADLIGIVGTTVQILDYNLGNLLMGRFINGIAGGINASIIPVYLSNFTPIIIRRKTGTFLQIFASLGNFFSLSLGEIQPRYVNGEEKQQQIEQMSNFHIEWAWRITIGLSILFAGIRLIFLTFVYLEETPIQMAQHHHLRTLKKYLFNCYKKDRADIIFKEILELQKFVGSEEDLEESDDEDSVGVQHFELGSTEIQITTPKLEKKQSSDLTKLDMEDNKAIISNQDQNRIISINCEPSDDDYGQEKTQNKEEQSQANNIIVDKRHQKKIIFKSQKRRKRLGIVAQCAAQLNGANALVFFSQSIFKANLKSQDHVQIFLHIQGASQFFFTFISIFFIEKYGYKKLIITSTVIVLVGLLGISISSILDSFYSSFAFIILFLFGNGIGLAAAVWPFCAELVNKSDIAICTCFRWGCVLLIGITFKFIVQGLQIYGAFFIFFGFTFIAFIYFLKEMKETKGLTPQQIDELYCC